ncbi:MAG: hypothetical protein QOI47_1656, partial [Actinomycetota bacterium]|nr:hypothetical protein [Actinomycetota bacterium]
ATGGATPSVPLPIGTLRAAALPVSCSSVTGTVADLVTSLQNVVGGVVTSVLDTLDHTSLLSVQGIELGLVADAKSTVAASVANVTGTIGSVKVGSLTVPAASGLDLTAPASVLNAAGATVSGAVGQVLGLVNAQLANMVKVDVLQIQKLVAANGAYTTATAGLTALKATITPPALLTGAALNVTGTAGDLLGSIGTAVPPLAPAMGTLEGALGGLNLLSAASTITVGQLSSTSAFRAVAAAAPTSPGGSDLPRTGSNAAVPAIAAVLVGGMALGIRRFLATLVA